MDALRRVLAHPQSRGVALLNGALTLDRRRIVGLHRFLDRHGPWTEYKHAAAACAACRRRAVAQRRRRAAGLREREFRATKRSATTTLIRTSAKDVCRRASAVGHGQIVDADFARYCRARDTGSVAGTMPATADRCSRALARRLDALGWQPVRTQVPVSSATLGFASFIDMVCVDRATRQQLCVVELKASRQRTSRACYDVSVRRERDMAQLVALRRAVRETGARVACSLLLRSSPGGVDQYTLGADEARRLETVLKSCRTTRS